jgi:hypothetical protein
MGKTAQWILDARKAKREHQDSLPQITDPVKERARIKALKRSQNNTAKKGKA